MRFFGKYLQKIMLEPPIHLYLEGGDPKSLREIPNPPLYVEV